MFGIEAVGDDAEGEEGVVCCEGWRERLVWWLEDAGKGGGCTGHEGSGDGEELGDCDADYGLLVEVLV